MDWARGFRLLLTVVVVAMVLKLGLTVSAVAQQLTNTSVVESTTTFYRTINFDDISSSSQNVDFITSYDGFAFGDDNYWLNTATYPVVVGTGFEEGNTSPTFVAFAGSSLAYTLQMERVDGAAFGLIAFNATPAWVQQLDLLITAYGDNDTVVDSMTITLNRLTHVVLPTSFYQLDKVTLQSVPGTSIGSRSNDGSGLHVAFDDIVVAISEASSSTTTPTASSTVLNSEIGFPTTSDTQSPLSTPTPSTAISANPTLTRPTTFPTRKPTIGVFPTSLRETINFDDIVTSTYFSAIGTYKNFVWGDDNFSLDVRLNSLSGSGYRGGNISPNRVAFAGSSSNYILAMQPSNGASFSLIEFYATPAWVQQLNLLVTAYDNNNVVKDSISVTLASTTQVKLPNTFYQIHRVTMQSTAGTEVGSRGVGVGLQVAFDDIVISSVCPGCPSSAPTSAPSPAPSITPVPSVTTTVTPSQQPTTASPSSDYRTLTLGFDSFVSSRTTAFGNLGDAPYEGFLFDRSNYWYDSDYTDRADSGYRVGTISPNKVAFATSPGYLFTMQRQDGQLFSIRSFYATAAWIVSVTLRVTAYDRFNNILLRRDVRVDGVTHVMLPDNFVNLFRVTLESVRGTEGNSRGTGGSGRHVALDDIVVLVSPFDLPTNQPTRAPFRAPTLAPTIQVHPYLQYDSVIRFAGINNCSLLDADQRALLAAVGVSMSIDPSSLAYRACVIDSAGNNRKLLHDSTTTESTLTVQTTYLMTTSAGQSDARTLFQSFSASLDSAINSGDFDTELKRTVDTFRSIQLINASALSSTTSTFDVLGAPTASPVGSPTISRSENSGGSSSNNAISYAAIIATPIVVVLVALGTLLYCVKKTYGQVGCVPEDSANQYSYTATAADHGSVFGRNDCEIAVPYSQYAVTPSAPPLVEAEVNTIATAEACFAEAESPRYGHTTVLEVEATPTHSAHYSSRRSAASNRRR